ncbi:MAG: hypothetical protein LKG27_04120 [Clostridiaceae bacterium]|jgi:hypothetical protein|nr:hypothetical protein [Clostridiaceae bacterium]
MLAIQLGLNKSCRQPAFKSNEDFDNESNIDAFDDAKLEKQPADDSFDIMKANEEDYNKEEGFWKNQKAKFDDLSSDKNIPPVVKKGMEVASVGVSGILGGMAMAWGSKKSITALEDFSKTKPVMKFNNQVKTATKDFKKAMTNAVDTYKKSEFATKLDSNIKVKTIKIKNSKFGKNVIVKAFVNCFKAIKNAIKGVYNFIVKTIKGIKPEQAKKATVNTLGVSGGVTSGIATLKEIKKENRKAEFADRDE